MATLTTASAAESDARVAPRRDPMGVTGSRYSGPARNTVFNILGRAIPALIGIPCVPFIVRGLGPDRFGLLGIIWALLIYFNLFDLGFGRASVKLIAELRAGGRPEKVASVVWTSLAAQVVLGFAGAAVFYLATPVFVERVLKVPLAMRGEARTTFLIIALSLPLLLLGNGMQAVLEGCHRFDLLNAVRIPSLSLLFVLPALGAPLGLHLPGIALLIVATRILAGFTCFSLCARVIPELTRWKAADREITRRLLSFGGWVTVISIIDPILLYLDRFLIGSILSIALVGYYTAPFEGVTRALWLFPTSLGATLFPLSSALGIQAANKGYMQALYVRSFKILLLALVPAASLIFVFAPEIVKLWLGPSFATYGVGVIRILSVGVLVSCFVHLPSNFIYGLGRPDVVAKLLLTELPFYAPFCYLMVRGFGIDGAALAWSIRVAVDVALMTFFAHRLFGMPLAPFRERGAFRAFLLAASLVALLLVTTGGHLLNVWARGGIALILLAAYGWAVWRWALDDADRTAATGVAGDLFLSDPAEVSA